MGFKGGDCLPLSLAVVAVEMKQLNDEDGNGKKTNAERIEVCTAIRRPGRTYRCYGDCGANHDAQGPEGLLPPPLGEQPVQGRHGIGCGRRGGPATAESGREMGERAWAKAVLPVSNNIRRSKWQRMGEVKKLTPRNKALTALQQCEEKLTKCLGFGWLKACGLKRKKC